MSAPEVLRRHVSPQEMIDFTVDHGAPSFAPGAVGQWACSNSGYTLLGMVIERTLSLALNKAFENRIFGPLGMQECYLRDDTPRDDFGLARS